MIKLLNYSKEDILKEADEHGFLPTIACLLGAIADYTKLDRDDNDAINENIINIRDILLIVDKEYALTKRDK